jgi:nitrite reductase/ring-hydroxylating ferredoxin subunit/uncharacterized membrane protein
MLDPELSVNRRLVDRLSYMPLLAAVAKAVQPIVRAALDRCGSGVRNALHGTFFGHPLHPVITDVPVGAWTVTAVLDALEICGVPDVAPGADAALCVGIVAAGGAAITGFSDWSDTRDESRNLGVAHATLNSAALLCYVAALRERLRGRRGAGIAWATGGYVLVAGGGYLGGELSFGMQLGARRTGDPHDPPDDFTRACRLDEIEDGNMRRVDLAGVPVLLLRRGSTVRAIAAVCTHRGGPLQDGTLSDDCVTCPWHGSVFRFSDGSVARGPATFPVASYDCRVSNDVVEVRRRVP